MAVYLRDFTFPPEARETAWLARERRTCFRSFYPFGVLPRKGVGRVEFAEITVFCGGNGSGKSTMLNVIAARLGLPRELPFDPSAFFAGYVGLTDFNSGMPSPRTGIPAGSRILCSEDVFDRTLGLRELNRGIGRRREEVGGEWMDANFGRLGAARLQTLHGESYKEWKRGRELRKRSQSETIRREAGLDAVTGSNGQNALDYFMERVRERGLYLLDEPENSLSAAWQAKLAEFLEGMARFEGCQFVVATHSPFLLGIRGARILDLDGPEARVRRWTELENVQAFRRFFREREGEFGKAP